MQQDFAAADLIFQRAIVSEVAAQSKALAFCKRGDEFAALGSIAFVHNPDPEIGNGGVQSQSEKKDLHGGRDNQGDGKTTVTPDLVELFFDQSAQTGPEARGSKIGVHAFTCMLRMERQLMR